MPKPRFVVPNPENLDPVWPAQSNPGGANAKLTAGELRAMQSRRTEGMAASVPVIGGLLKPLAQFSNALASPDTKVGIFTGPVNGISKLGNAIGDLVQGKPIDVKDAWTISDQQARQFNPFRIGIGQEVTASDDAGLAIGEGIGAEIVGAATGATLLNKAKQIRQLQTAAQAIQQSQRVQNAAVAVATTPALRAGANVAKNVGQTLLGTGLAAAFLDQEDGNLANMGDAAGLKLPGRVEQDDNYLEAFGKSLAVEGIAAPLALMGLGSFIAPIRKGLATGDLGAIDELANAQLEPYRPLGMGGSTTNDFGKAPPGPWTTGWDPARDPWIKDPGSTTNDFGKAPPGPWTTGWDPARDPWIKDPAGLPPAYGTSAPADAASAAAGFTREQGDRLNDFAKAQPGPWSQGWDPARSPWDTGGPIVPYDSAIGRSLQEQTQIRQVTEQRQRLQDMGLVEVGEGGQLEFRPPEVVAARRQEIEILQAQREQLLRDAEDAGQQPGPEVGVIDQQITDLLESGKGEDFMPGPRYQQPELDMPDPRPEIDTVLAQLDEMSDDQLRNLYNESLGGGPEARNAQALLDAQTRVDEITQRLEAIQERADAGQVTPAGAKRMVTKVQKELAAAEAELRTIESRREQPQPSVAEQLVAELGPEQLGLDLTPSLADELAPIRSLQWQRGQLQRLVDDAEELLRGLRESKADSGDIAAASKRLKGARGALTALDTEITDARKAVSPEAQLRLTSERWRDRETAVSEFGYETPDDYRNALQTWGRDDLRRLAMPESSPEVAALVLARTGRRVWGAKKADIIDALVEMSERRGRYLPPRTDVVVDQPDLALTINAVGGDTPLLDRPAELAVPGMGRVLDADGVEQLVPMVEYRRRGMDAQTREELKAEILRALRDQDAIQPPVTAIPKRPVTAFEQGAFLDELMADETGQMAFEFSTGLTPTYQAGRKGADALVEEMRLRFEYNQLDGEALKAQRDAYLAERGWAGMTWEEKKRLGILGEGFYSLQPFRERFRDPTPAFTPELAVRGDRPEATYRTVKLNAVGDLVDAEPTAGAGKKPPKQKPATAPKQPVEEAATPEADVGGKAASKAQEPVTESKVGMGKARNSSANVANLTRQEQELTKLLEQKKRQLNKKGGC